MYCKKCGNDIGDGNFCPYCGEKVDVPVYDADLGSGGYNNENGGGGGVRCPKCGAGDCQPIVETTVTGGGYSAGNGCCGYILFGPLGLLCGACGSGTKTYHNRYWVCKNCGKKFKM